MAGGGIMGSNAGSMLVAPTADGSRPGYGWNPLDWIPNEIKDPVAKVYDKIIPNELKNPLVAAVAANYLPKMLPGGSDQTLIQQAIQKGINPMNLVGDNEPLDIEDWNPNAPEITIRKPVSGETSWSIGDALGNLVGGAGNVAKKIGQTIIPGGETGYADLYGGATNVLGGIGNVARKGLETIIPGGETGYGDIYGTAGNVLSSIFGGAANAAEAMKNVGIGATQGIWSPGVEHSGMPQDSLLKRFGEGILGVGKKIFSPSEGAGKWTLPLTAGLAAGKYQSDWLKDQPAFPMDETGIKFQTAAEAMADEDLRFKPEAQYANVAEGGRIGYRLGNSVGSLDADTGKGLKDIFISFSDYKSGGGKKDFVGWYNDIYASDTMAEIPRAYAEKPWEFQGYAEPGTIGSPEAIGVEYNAQGGRIGYDDGGMSTMMAGSVSQDDMLNDLSFELFGKPVKELTPPELRDFWEEVQRLNTKVAQGGRIGAQEGGLMDLGGMEKDYRQEGGFVPIGGREKADDVPARLSKNEFVFTADAVRNAGGGDIDAGAQVMENLMEHLEAGGKVSEDSQGLEGAQAMFANAQALEKRII